MMHKTMVTGAAGFIGSALVRNLVKNDMPVVATARSHIDALSQELGTPVVELDIMLKTPDFEGIDTLVHCASPNDIQSKEEDGGLPLAVMGTYKLLHEAAKQGVRRVIFLSTRQVYGTELSGGVNENTPVKCESPYGLNHYLGEEVCRFFAQSTGMDIVALRPSNVYGVPEASTVNRHTLVPMCFVNEAFESGSITLLSSGKQKRNFVSTDEVSNAIIEILSEFPVGYTVINAVSNWNASIIDIASMVSNVWEEKFNKKLHVNVLSNKPENPCDFEIFSQHVSSKLTKNESKKFMFDVINGLVETKLNKR